MRLAYSTAFDDVRWANGAEAADGHHQIAGTREIPELLDEDDLVADVV